MAQQTSAIQRNQTTPRPIGRLMDADVSGPFFLVVSKSAGHTQPIYWRYRRPRRGVGRGHDDDKGRDVVAQDLVAQEDTGSEA
jgi:hypothetical protein